MPAGYYRFPTIYAERVVFVSEDDLWEVPASGGIARRLTSNLGEVSRPCFSPDGQMLAFVGREEGQSEVYVMPALGGPARRLTYLGAAFCRTQRWTPDGRIVFASNAEQWHPGATELFTIAPEDTLPVKLPYGVARSIDFGPNGGMVLGRNTDDPARWKRYQGGTAGQILIDPDGRGDFRPLISVKGNLTSPLWVGERIFFISDFEGIGNLYSCLPSGEDLQRHTDHEDYYARHASTDGRTIVYHAGADIFRFEPASGRSEMIPVEYFSPRVQRNRRFVPADRYLNEYSLHPRGQAVAIATRGKMFSFANWEGAVQQYSVDPEKPVEAEAAETAVRYRLPTWLHDGKRLVAVTDYGGEESFVLWSGENGGETVILSGLDIGRPEAVAVNPRKDQVVFSNHRYELCWLDLETRALRRIDRGKANPITGFSWSPDGEWVAYSVSTSLSVTALKLWNVASGESHTVVSPLIRDVAPSFDPNGKYLYFLSYRSFDPVYDNIQFDLSFPRGMKPYLVTLQKDTPSPFVPRPQLGDETCSDEPNPEPEPEPAPETQGAVRSEDPLAVESEPGPDGEGPAERHDTTSPSAEEGKEKKTRIQVDLDGIEQRILAFPVPEGIYGRVAGAKNGKAVYTRFPVEGAIQRQAMQDHAPRGTLYAYNFEEQKEEHLTNGISDFAVSMDGAFLIYRSDKRLRVLKAGEKPADEGSNPSRRTGWLNLDRVKVQVTPGAEWRQMFREAWRLQRDQFWDPAMSQVDWLSVHDRYLSLVDRVSSRSEFSDLMWEMQGELATSHAYESGGDYRPGPFYSQGYLGAEYAFSPEQGGWLVTRVLQGDPWDTNGDSPFNEPGSNLHTGDILLAINGLPLSRSVSPAKALVNLAGEEVTIRYLSQDGGSWSPCWTTVRALASETPLRYREWVESNRRRVHEATGGRTGYIHIPDMMATGFAEFHRGFLSEIDRDSLIVDVRFNRGGHVSALLLEKLARKRLGYDKARWMEVATPYPQESVLGPIVALTNELAGSDGDIFSHGFKMMKIGPLIGKRTWGGVVGIWPRHNLVDGSTTTQPEFSFWFHDVGWGVENYGTDPDIEVDNLPQDAMHGIDRQLERAIEEVKRLLVENPPRVPQFDQRPSRAIPRLPKR